MHWNSTWSKYIYKSRIYHGNKAVPQWKPYPYSLHFNSRKNCNTMKYYKKIPGSIILKKRFSLWLIVILRGYIGYWMFDYNRSYITFTFTTRHSLTSIWIKTRGLARRVRSLLTCTDHAKKSGFNFIWYADAKRRKDWPNLAKVHIELGHTIVTHLIIVKWFGPTCSGNDTPCFKAKFKHDISLHLLCYSLDGGQELS